MARCATADGVAEVAVLFADLAGFTALTEAHGDEEAARAAIRLLELTHAAYDGHALVVKSIGDGVMVVFDDVAAAVSAGLALSQPPGRSHASWACGSVSMLGGRCCGAGTCSARRQADVL